MRNDPWYPNHYSQPLLLGTHWKKHANQISSNIIKYPTISHWNCIQHTVIRAFDLSTPVLPHTIMIYISGSLWNFPTANLLVQRIPQLAMKHGWQQFAIRESQAERPPAQSVKVLAPGPVGKPSRRDDLGWNQTCSGWFMRIGILFGRYVTNLIWFWLRMCLKRLTPQLWLFWSGKWERRALPLKLGPWHSCNRWTCFYCIWHFTTRWKLRDINNRTWQPWHAMTSLATYPKRG